MMIMHQIKSIKPATLLLIACIFFVALANAQKGKNDKKRQVRKEAAATIQTPTWTADNGNALSPIRFFTTNFLILI